VPVESVPEGATDTVCVPVPVPAMVTVVYGPVNVTELEAVEPEDTDPVLTEPDATGVCTITVPVESVPEGARVTVESTLPIPA
jgi:hypothetical protein